MAAEVLVNDRQELISERVGGSHERCRFGGRRAKTARELFPNALDIITLSHSLTHSAPPASPHFSLSLPSLSHSTIHSFIPFQLFFSSLHTISFTIFKKKINFSFKPSDTSATHPTPPHHVNLKTLVMLTSIILLTVGLD